MGWMTKKLGVNFQQSSLLQSIHTISRVNTTFCLVQSGGLSPWRYSSQGVMLIIFAAEVKNARRYTFISPSSFMVWCRIMHRDFFSIHLHKLLVKLMLQDSKHVAPPAKTVDIHLLYDKGARSCAPFSFR